MFYPGARLFVCIVATTAITCHYRQAAQCALARSGGCNQIILTPFGILLPQFADLSIYFSTSSIISDFIVDVLQRWWQNAQPRFPKVDTLVIEADPVFCTT